MMPPDDAKEATQGDARKALDALLKKIKGRYTNDSVLFGFHHVIYPGEIEKISRALTPIPLIPGLDQAIEETAVYVDVFGEKRSAIGVLLVAARIVRERM